MLNERVEDLSRLITRALAEVHRIHEEITQRGLLGSDADAVRSVEREPRAEPTDK